MGKVGIAVGPSTSTKEETYESNTKKAFQQLTFKF